MTTEKIRIGVRFLGVLMAILLGIATNAAGQRPVECNNVPIAPNPIQAGNALCGTTNWQIGIQGAFNREIEGYTSATSVNKGETITFYVNQTFPATTPKFKFEIYRMGWYQGNGGRLVYSRNNISGTHQIPPQSKQATGLMECNWTLGPDATSQYQWTVPTSAVSGVYLVKLLTEPDGYAAYMIFVVRDDARQSDIVYQTSETTWQAYNNYPGDREHGTPTVDPTYTGKSYSGMSLYNTTAFGRDDIPGGEQRARKVSFNRPYGQDNNRIDLTAGQFFTWEYNMVRWIERKGYDVSYISNLDTHTADAVNGRFAPGRHKTFLSVGHDEYWSWEMRNNVETIRNRSTQPTNLAFFSANTMFWQIRFESSSTTNTQPADEEYRTIVAYKTSAEDANPTIGDPNYTNTSQTDNHKITYRWRDNKKNIGTCDSGGSTCYRPSEDEVIGVQYSIPFNEVSTSSTENPDDTGGVCLTGTCPAFGDLKIPSGTCPTWTCSGMQQSGNEYYLGPLIGYEADRIFPTHNYTNRNSFVKIGDSPVYNFYNSSKLYTYYNSHLVYFTLANSAKVFSTGTIQYPWGLDDYAPVYDNTGQRTHPIYTDGNAQRLAENVFGCLVGGICQ